MAPPVLSVLDAVPSEVLSEIFLYLCNSFGVGFLKPCLHVCKHWHAIARPLFHRDVFLFSSEIAPFDGNIDSSIAVHVKFLSIQIVHRYTGDQYHWAYLDMLASRMKLLTNLQAFSLVVFPQGLPKAACNYYIHHKHIVGLLDELPSSCTQLELDTNRFYYCRSACCKNVHVCDAIRRLVPRLHHLRLRLNTMCAAILSDESASPAPHLETLVINCIPGSIYAGASSKTCRKPYEQQSPFDVRLSRQALATTARAMYDDGKFPKAVHLCIVDVQKGNSFNEITYPTLHQRDIIRNETWCMPYASIHSDHYGHLLRMAYGGEMHLLRTADKGEVLASLKGMLDLVEGSHWSETTNGIRLATSTLRAEASELGRRVVRELPFLSVADWKARHPEISCALWINEQRTGMCLLRAVRLDGLFGTHVSIEETPKGWVRHRTELVAE